MRLRCVFLSLWLAAQVAAFAQTPVAAHAEVAANVHESLSSVPVPEPAGPRLVSAPLAEAVPLSLGRELYLDVFGILREENSCSSFYGGPVQAVEVFNELARQLRVRHFDDRALALQMSGRYTIYRDMLTGAVYRLFNEASLNGDGPFFSRGSSSQAWRLKVGSFPLQTRKARALLLLHELGHLVKGPDEKWVLPNDGGDELLSLRNTRLVESHCGPQLQRLKD